MIEEIEIEDKEEVIYIANSVTNSSIGDLHYELLLGEDYYYLDCGNNEEEIIIKILNKYPDLIYERTSLYIQKGWELLWEEYSNLIKETIKQYIKKYNKNYE